jgi:hypothetical protein
VKRRGEICREGTNRTAYFARATVKGRWVKKVDAGCHRGCTASTPTPASKGLAPKAAGRAWWGRAS